ncbi:MAG: hypothetical protein OXM01_07275 [Gemmatimonadota bacterium]|nr:hypothetical protein [Gemmatimonadota bacterium]
MRHNSLMLAEPSAALGPDFFVGRIRATTKSTTQGAPAPQVQEPATSAVHANLLNQVAPFSPFAATSR